MTRNGLPLNQWQKSSYSADNGGNCVEVQAVTAAAAVACRDSKDPARGAFLVSVPAWGAFLGALGRGSGR